MAQNILGRKFKLTLNEAIYVVLCLNITKKFYFNSKAIRL